MNPATGVVAAQELDRRRAGSPVSSKSSRAAHVSASSPSTSSSARGDLRQHLPHGRAGTACTSRTSPRGRDRQHGRGTADGARPPMAEPLPVLDVDREDQRPSNAVGRAAGLRHAGSAADGRPCGPRRARRCVCAAPTNSRNSGWGRVGRDRSSGWNCPAMKNGWSGSSMISVSRPLCELPDSTSPSSCSDLVVGGVDLPTVPMALLDDAAP